MIVTDVDEAEAFSSEPAVTRRSLRSAGASDGAAVTGVLVGCSHGTADPAGRATVHALLAGVEEARPDLDVREAFVDVQQPEVADVVRGALADRPDVPVVVVPLLLSAGFHVHVDIAAAVDGTPAVAARPLGPDPRLAELLAQRLDEAGTRPDDVVVLAAAGSSDPRAVEAVEQVALALHGLRGGTVVIGYGSASEPRVPAAVAQARSIAGGGRVVIASYLLAPGFFHDRLAEAGADVVTAPLGPDARLVDIALDRFAEALAEAGDPAGSCG